MTKQLPFHLILASASPARRELLERASYSFEVEPANIDEPMDKGFEDPRSLVQHIAWLKAAAVAQRGREGSGVRGQGSGVRSQRSEVRGQRTEVRGQGSQLTANPSHLTSSSSVPDPSPLIPHPYTLILAADTIGWLDGQPIGKPADEGDARRILRFLSGRKHELWTGVCLWRCGDDVQIAWQEMSRVAFKALTERELDDYLLTRKWQGCSGAYAILEHDDPFVRVVQGSISNVIGLPMESLERVLAWLAQSSSQ